MLQYDVDNTLSAVQRLTFLRRLKWTFGAGVIPLSRHFLIGEDKEPTDLSEERSETVTIAELQSFIRRSIPQVDVRMKECHRL